MFAFRYCSMLERLLHTYIHRTEAHTKKHLLVRAANYANRLNQQNRNIDKMYEMKRRNVLK